MVLSAVISGGSLTGLMFGVILLDLGYKVTILERASSVESQGAGIVLGRFSKAFFNQFDATKTVVGVPANRRQFLFEDGSVMALDPTSLLMTTWDKLYYVLRANFDGLDRPGYLDNPPRPIDQSHAVYRTACTVVSFARRKGGSKVLVQYKNQETMQELEADLLVCAEGGSSNLRKGLFPETDRAYSGYLAFRGLVPESQLSSQARRELINSLTVIHATNTQFLCYAVPGGRGSVKNGDLQMNFVWYNNFQDGSDALEKVMRDKDGVRRTNSVGAGLVDPSVIKTEILPRARAFLPPDCLEVVEKTAHPFIQLVTDVISPSAVFADGHVLIVGDALCSVRPHTTAATNQAAEHALSLHSILKSGVDFAELDAVWQPDRMAYAKSLMDIGARMGNLSQFEEHPMSIHVKSAPEKERYLDEGLKVGEPK